MIIKVKVKPNKEKQEIRKISENEFEIFLTEKAEKGKANKELIKLLSRYFKVPSSHITIKNPVSREKIVSIIDL